MPGKQDTGSPTPEITTNAWAGGPHLDFEMWETTNLNQRLNE